MGKKREGKRRFNWLAAKINANEYKVGAEVGAFKGATTAYILSRCLTLEQLYVVDLWGIVPEYANTPYWQKTYGTFNNNRFTSVRKQFTRAIAPFKDRVSVVQKLSWDGADYVEDGVLDFVFIDADHAYESVYKDIRAWTPKLRAGGMLSGHDVNLVGIERATGELCQKIHVPGVDNCWWCSKEDVML